MFEQLTSDKAYLLGFISADGNVHNTTLRIELQHRDYNLLVKFCDVFKSSGFTPHLQEISKQIGNNQYSRLGIYSRALVEELKLFNITPNKSFTISVPDIQEDFWPDYIRGVFDGDGSIYYKERKDYEPMLQIELCSASLEFLQAINIMVSKIAEVSAKNIRTRYKGNRTNPLYCIAWYSNDAFSILHHLYYDDTSLFLDRKREMYLSYNKPTSSKYWTFDQIQFLKDHYRTLSITEIASSLNRSYKAITKKVWELGLSHR